MYEPRHVGRIYGRACLAIDDGHAADIPPDILRELFPHYIDALHRLTDPGRALAKAQREYERAHPAPPGEDTERMTDTGRNDMAEHLDLDAILDRAGEWNVLEDIRALVDEVRRQRRAATETRQRVEHMENVMARIPAGVLEQALHEAGRPS